MNDKKERIRELVDILNKASKAYYSEDIEIMSNFEYDALYDELEALEKRPDLCFPILLQSMSVLKAQMNL